MNKRKRLSIAAIGLAAGFAVLGEPAFAQAAAPLQSQETSVEGVTAEILEAVRKEGVLTLKVRYRNTGAAPAKVTIYENWSDDQYYVTAGSTKFLILKDSKGISLAVPHGGHGGLSAEIKPKGSFLFWAKYPAPPAEAKKINFYNWQHTPPFEDIPITEAK